MRLKTDLKRIKKLSIELGNLMDSRNSKVCSDCKHAYSAGMGTKRRVRIKTVLEARKLDRIASKEAGCCSVCSEWYFKHLDEDNYKQYEKLKRLYNYDEFYHFFDTDKKCCTLPRHKRPITCLSWGLFCIFREKEIKLIRKVQKICRIIEHLRIRNKLIY